MESILKAVEQFIQYHQQKYIAPQKAGDDEEYMLQFKKDGGIARKAFQTLVNKIDEQQILFNKQRVSNWMNQAQFARAYFYCFFRQPGDLVWQPGFALRLYEENGRIGVTWEVSVLERTLSEKSLPMQHRLLSVPIQSPSYYLTYSDGIETIYPGTEDNRYYLAEAVAEGKIRKVLVKEMIGFLDEFSTIDEFTQKALVVLDRLYPYYLATRENVDVSN